MSVTRSSLELQLAEQLDGVGDPRFSSSNTLIRPIVDAVFRRGWSRLLKANRSYRWAKRTVTTDATSRVTIASLDGGTGDTLERAFKILAVAEGTIRYTPAEFMDDPLAEAATPGALRYTFERQGDSILFLPIRAGTALSVWVNHIPQRPSQLTSDSALIVWPEDYEMILVYEAAARMAAKGAAETGITDWFQRLADDLWEDCLGDIARFTTDPLTMGASDLAADWGSA